MTTITGFSKQDAHGAYLEFKHDDDLRERLTLEHGRGDGSALLLVALDVDGTKGVHRIGVDTYGAEEQLSDAQHIDRAIKVLRAARKELTP